MTYSFLSSEEFDEQAHLHYDAGEYEQALEVLREGLKRYPESVDLHVGLGYTRLAREEFAWARKSFEAALALDPEHEDGWVGMGEVLLKFGQTDAALRCFRRVDDLGLGTELELGLAVGRALYREGFYRESRERLTRLAAANRDSAEVRAALGYTLHALGDDVGARRELRGALRLDPELHEVRIYLSHLLFERGDMRSALTELERVPASEHWDPLSVWRFMELKCSLDGLEEGDEALRAWRERWEELRADPDGIDHLLAEVETAFEEAGGDLVTPTAPHPAAAPLALEAPRPLPALPPARGAEVHRVRTADGEVFTGTWDEIVVRMRDSLSDPSEPISSFMSRAAQRVRNLTGRDIPCDDAESFLRESARIGLLHIED